MKDNLLHLSNVPEAHELAQLHAQMQRPARNSNADGGFEIGWGCALLCFGLSHYFVASLPKSVFVSSWTSWITFLPLACAAFAPYAIPKVIKRHITWPRTGYVANTYDLKLTQLLMLMGFGLALGTCLSLPFVIISEIGRVDSGPGPRVQLHTIILDGIKFLVCAILAVYLGGKLIRKPAPVPSAYDASAITQGLRQTAMGRRRLRVVKFASYAFLFGAPLIVCAVAFGLMYLSKGTVGTPEGTLLRNNVMGRFAQIRWSQLGMPSFLVGANTMLYFMASGVLLKQNAWKWLMVVTMLVGTVLIAPLIPYHETQPALVPILAPLPPVMLALGFTWLLSGTITLILFVRRNPFPVAATS
jgi:hypothetical protein